MRFAIINLYSNFKKNFFSLLLLTDNNPTFLEKAQMFCRLLLTFGPISFLLEKMQLWFYDNRTFVLFVGAAILANLVIGGWFHYKVIKDFNWKLLIKKTALMLFVVISAYYLLEQLRLIIGDSNPIADGFKVVIQLATLFYPTSKALKNIYILSNREFPPAWIMERVYNFEKTGDFSNFNFDSKINKDEQSEKH